MLAGTTSGTVMVARTVTAPSTELVIVPVTFNPYPYPYTNPHLTHTLSHLYAGLLTLNTNPNRHDRPV